MFSANAQNADSTRFTPRRPKVGVVLSGGGAKGFAHIGALRVIEEAGIPIDYIAGTSMGSIIGGLYAVGYDPDMMQKGLRVIVGETERLSEMVEELLDFSRMQSGHFTLQMDTMDILAELGDAVLIYAERAKQDGIYVTYEEPEMLPFVCGDKNRIRQVFINIIDNAIKYSDKDGHVYITAEAEKDGSAVRVIVQDDGCGIKAEDLPKIKTKFYKPNHTRRGSGIGLAVADEIISLHNGTLTIESEEGVGTRVTITLPAQKPRTENG